MNRSTLIVVGLTVMGFLLRFYRLDLPDRLIGDEVYYVPAARSILGNNEEGVPRDTIRGHPPLAKMLIAAGMLFFGDNPLGWRIMSVVAGTLAIPVFYLLVRRLFGGRRGVAYAPLIATYIFSFETLTFYFSRVARIDIFMLLYLFYILIVLPPVIIALSLYLGNRLHSERGTKNIRWRGLTALYLLLHLLNFVALYPVPAA